MHRYSLFLVFILEFVAYAQQAIVVSNVPGTVSIAAVAPYTSVMQSRIELRLTGLSTCKTAHPYAANILNIGGLAVGCTETGVKSLAVATGSGSVAPLLSSALLGDTDDILMTVQRNGVDNKYFVDAWSADGTKIYTGAVLSSGGVGAINTSGLMTLLPANSATSETNYTAQVAFVRWYSKFIPQTALPIPKATDPIVTDRMLFCEFEGSGNAARECIKSDGSSVTISKSGAKYATTSTDYKPIVQAYVSNGVAGSTMTVDLRYTFAYSGAISPSGYMTQWVSGPAEPIIKDARSVTPTVSRLVAGEHVFQFSATDSRGQTTTVSQPVLVSNKDKHGLAIYPMAEHQLAAHYAVSSGIPIAFDLRSVPNAVDVQISIRKGDGGVLNKQTFTSSPASVQIDPRQLGHQYRLVYRDASGKVLADGDWTPVPTTQQAPPTRIRQGTDYLKPFVYLPQNSVAALGQARSDASARYMAQRLYGAFLGVSRSPAQYNPDVMAVAYYDGTSKQPQDTSIFHDISDARGFTWEKVWLHFRTNFSYSLDPAGTNGNGAGWNGMEQFDAFDTANGILTSSNGVVFNDITGRSGSGAVTNANKLYIGSGEPFDEVNLAFSTPGSGCSVVWEQATGVGTWAPVTPSLNTTSGYTASGKLMFRPLSSWRRVTLNGGHKKWWMRATWSCSGTYPTIGSIKGWDLRTGELNSYGRPVFPGFCSTDTDNSRINKGLTGDAYSLEYEPNPPAICKARFRWQSRPLGIWASNNMLFNFDMVENGRRVVPTLLADQLAPRLVGGTSGENLTGVYLDSIFEMNTKDFVHPAHSNIGNGCTTTDCRAQAVKDILAQTEYGPTSYLTRLTSSFADLKAYLREYFPGADLAVNTNQLDVGTSPGVDSFLLEGGNWIPRAWRYLNHNYEAAPTIVYDDLRPYSDPCEHVMAISYGDSTYEFATGGWYPWDRGNRGPMMALAGHYVATPGCVGMFYTVNTPAGYYAYDDYTYWPATADYKLSEDLPKNKQFPIQSITTGGVITFASPISVTPGSRLYVNGTSSTSRNENAFVVVSQADPLTVTISGTGAATGGYAILDEPVIMKGNFGRIAGGNGNSRMLMSIGEGTVRLSATLPGLAVNAPVYVSGTTDSNQTRVVKVNSIASDGLSFTTLHPAMQAASTGGTVRTVPMTGFAIRKIGTTGEVANTWKVDDSTLMTEKIVWNDYPAGSGVSDVRHGQLSYDALPPVGRIYHWGNFFPAMDIDVGKPISDRVDPWKTAAESGVKNGIIRRDYEHAIMLMAFPNSIWRSTPLPPTYGLQPTRAQTMTGYSPAYEINVNGSAITVYPLQADGRTNNAQCNYGPGEDYRTPDGGCSRVKIRTAEGLVLMKKPVS